MYPEDLQNIINDYLMISREQVEFNFINCMCELNHRGYLNEIRLYSFSHPRILHIEVAFTVDRDDFYKYLER